MNTSSANLLPKLNMHCNKRWNSTVFSHIQHGGGGDETCGINDFNYVVDRVSEGSSEGASGRVNE